jgi:hypothetical protein
MLSTIHQPPSFLRLSLRNHCCIILRRLREAVLLVQDEVLLNQHDLLVVSHLLSKVHVYLLAFGADSRLPHLLLEPQLLLPRALATEYALAETTVVLACEDGELPEAFVAELHIVVWQHPLFLALQALWDYAVLESPFLLRGG